MKVTRPLFAFDAGWLFVLAGLAMCAAVVLIPAQRDLFLLRVQRDQLQASEQHNNARLRAHVDFLHELEQASPDLTRRLVASQLNLVPEGDTPVLRVADPVGAITSWIDAVAAAEPRPAPVWNDSKLSRLANGPRRVWLLGGGIMCVFLGLITGGPFASSARWMSTSVDVAAEDVTTSDDERLVSDDDPCARRSTLRSALPAVPVMVDCGMLDGEERPWREQQATSPTLNFASFSPAE